MSEINYNTHFDFDFPSAPWESLLTANVRSNSYSQKNFRCSPVSPIVDLALTQLVQEYGSDGDFQSNFDLEPVFSFDEIFEEGELIY
jgi:hypothetical protein